MAVQSHPVRADPARSYPVRVDATLDERGLSRWLWLVKWILVIPHALVLAVLWPVFVVLSAIALVAIVVTGRYPRAIFDVNVGVLRWTWRVAFYAAGGFATDRYPPFSLEERPDYPAHLEVEYPARLSRGLVLVKWWLLAIPHYLVLGFLAGGGTFVVSDGSGGAGWAGGLVALLAVVAAVVLLFTGRYPRSVFDLVLGLDRWVLRVAAYAALMTDEYPPFRLDQGGEDPGTIARTLAREDQRAATTRRVTSMPTPRPAWGAGRIVAVAGAAFAAVIGTTALVGGGGLAVVDQMTRDADGFLTSAPVTVRSPGYAVLTEDLQVRGDDVLVDLPERLLGTVRVESRDLTGRDTFVGIADSDDVELYLADVARSTLIEAGTGDDRSRYDEAPGGPPATAPGAQTFWLESAQGPGTQTIDWVPTSGDWTLVVMTADGASPSVSADVTVGATVPGLQELATGLVVGGLVLLAAAGLTFAAALSRFGRGHDHGHDHGQGHRPGPSG